MQSINIKREGTLTAAWKSSSERVLEAFAIAAMASRSVPECFMPMRLANSAGTSAAQSCNTLHNTMYFRHETADELDAARVALAFD